MRRNDNYSKQEHKIEIAKAMIDFIQRGGKIEKLPYSEDYDACREAKKQLRARYAIKQVINSVLEEGETHDQAKKD